MSTIGFLLCSLVWNGAAAVPADAEVQALIKGIRSESADIRAETWKNAGSLGAKAVGPLGDYLAPKDPSSRQNAETAKAARAALTNIVTVAGLQGNEAERRAVAEELVRLLAPKYPVEARREVLRLLGLIAGDEEVAAIASLLRDEALAEDARLALNQIPGDAAVEALAAALEEAPGPLRERIIDSLGHRRAESATEALKSVAHRGDQETAWVCLEALATLGVAPPDVLPMGLDFTAEEHIRYVTLVLRAADALQLKGETRAAEKLYLLLPRMTPMPHLQGAALLGLKDLQSQQSVPLALQWLGNPDLWKYATEVLRDADIPETDAHLVYAFEHAAGFQKSELLRILNARNYSDFPTLLDTALQNTAAEVRVAACELAGKTPPLPDVEEALTRSSMLGRERAALFALRLAREHMEKGETRFACALTEKVVRARIDRDMSIQCFALLEQAASPYAFPLLRELLGFPYAPEQAQYRSVASRDFLEAAKEDPTLGETCERAYVAVCAALPERDQAVTALSALAEHSPYPEVVAMAKKKLQEWGRGASSSQ